MNPSEQQIRKRNQLFDEKNEDRRWCWGCGQHNHLSRAHIVRYSSIPYEGSKLSLQMDIGNLSYLCMNSPKKKGCHTIWDDNSWTIEKEFWEIHNLACFIEFMQIIKDKDPHLYQKRLDQIIYWLNNSTNENNFRSVHHRQESVNGRSFEV